MTLSKSFPHRRTMRLPEFDYSQAGAYFVTIVAQDRKPYFGQVVDEEMVLNEVGKIVAEVWVEIPEHFLNVELGEFVVMPNHIHGIIVITVEATHANIVAARHAVPSQEDAIEKFGKPVPASLPTIMRSFKSAATKKVHGSTNYKEGRIWQRNYYEHVIRNERDYQAICDYILANPLNWEKDGEYSTT